MKTAQPVAQVSNLLYRRFPTGSASNIPTLADWKSATRQAGSLRYFFLLLLVTLPTLAAEVPAGYKLLHEETFPDATALTHFQFTDPNAWKFVTTNDAHAGTMELIQQSKYTPAVRSPVNIALIKEKVFGDFILEADFMQTGKEYGHRDMCIFFGFQSPTNFYYCHLATAADPNAHNIFIVNGVPRKNFAKETTKGVNWGLGVWRHVKLERDTAAGTIKVYFDDMAKPIMLGDDATFKTGAIGFGSFDDTGRVDNIKIWGKSVETKTLPEFPKTK